MADRDRTELLGTQQLRTLLEELAERLAQERIEARIHIVGGAAMALGYYVEGERRLTLDVDAALSPATEIAAVASEMAARHGLRADWLNEAAAQFFPPHGLPPGTVIIERGSATVMIADPSFLLAMKLRSARLGRDNDDIAILMRCCDVRSVEEAQIVLDEWYDGEEVFKAVARAIVEAGLGEYEVRSAIPPFTLPKVPPRS